MAHVLLSRHSVDDNDAASSTATAQDRAPNSLFAIAKPLPDHAPLLHVSAGTAVQ